MNRIAPSPGVTPGDVGKVPGRLKAAAPTDEMTPDDAPQKPQRLTVDQERVKWFNTPFAKRLEMLKKGDEPAWITNAEQRIEWLTRKVFGEPQREPTPEAAPDDKLPDRHPTTGAAAAIDVSSGVSIPRLNASMFLERLRAGLILSAGEAESVPRA